jgi:PhnB protein
MQLSPYLHFDGHCEAAFKFYEKSLGGQIQSMMLYDGTPMAEKMSPEWRKKIIHAEINIGGTRVMGSDVPPGQFQKPQGFSVSLDVKEPAEADRLFQALAEGGNVTMPIQKTFWAQRFGMATDRFGIPWIVNCGNPM